MQYIIFVKSEIDLSKTYYQNSRRGEMAIHVDGKANMLNKVAELRGCGEQVLSVRTALGGWANV